MILKGYLRHTTDNLKVFSDSSSLFVFTELIIMTDEEGSVTWEQINLKVINLDPEMQKQLEELKKERARKKKDRMRMGGAATAGAVIGGVFGVVGGPVGIAAGIAVGAAAGAAVGSIANRITKK
jgi:hypothetical protein